MAKQIKNKLKLKKRIEEYYDYDDFVEYFKQKYSIDLRDFKSKENSDSCGSLRNYLVFKKYINPGEITYSSYFWPQNMEKEEPWVQEIFEYLEKEFDKNDFSIKI